MNYLDITILVVMIIGIISGIRKGLIISILNIISIIITFVICFILMKPVSNLLIEYTNLSNYITGVVSERLNSLDSITIMIIEKLKIQGMTPNEFLTNSFINITTFIILFLIITIIMSFIKGGIKKSVKKSVISPIDSILGGILGFFKWIILLMIIFAFITPIMPLLNNNNEFYILVQESYIAKNFIDYNFIISMIKSFMDSNTKGLTSL